MKKWVTTMSLLVGICGVALSGAAQQATEVYIPIGQSPGLSGKKSIIGKIESVDQQRQLLGVTDTPQLSQYVVKLVEDTKIWLDKTKVRESNEAGNMSDCKSGLRCEIKYKYQGDRRLDEAEWIKIEVTR